MRIAIIQFPGSNCESESIRAIKQAGMEPVEFLWNEDYNKLKDFAGYFIVGGFSYEDRSRSGIISALDPLMPHIKAEAEKGKPVLGICNGAQILVETGMVPGLQNYQLGMALAVNKRVKDGVILGTGFYNTWVNIQSSTDHGACAFNKNFKQGEFMNIPIAHGEGRFIIPESLLAEMKNNHQDVFRYCDNNGQLHNEFPTNPNGSVESLAAVCNNAGNVMAMMPHPERTTNGQPIFTSMRDYIAKVKKIDLSHLTYTPPPPTIKKYEPSKNSTELLVKLIITDNEANTVKNALENLDIFVDVEKFIHWNIDFLDTIKDSTDLKNQTIASGELFNNNKEKIIERPKASDNSLLFLVRYKDDFVGATKKATLTKRFDITGIKNINKGLVWKISVSRGNVEEVAKFILESHILFNPFSQECYKY